MNASSTPLHDPPAWVRDAVFYQVFPDRFARSDRVVRPGPFEPWDAPPTIHGFKGGDLLGVAERLGYLADLGVTALYLNPVFASAANHRYHTYDYHTVDPLLGGEAALRELLDRAHERGMRVILDGVFNHVGRGFWPFHHVLEAGAASPYRDWFHLSVGVLERGQRLRAYPEAAPDDPPDVGWAEQHRAGAGSLDALGYRAWWDLPALPKLNIANPLVRALLLDVAARWIRFGADGWRVDVPEEINDLSFWAELRDGVREVNPEAYLVGEVWRVAPEWVGPGRFDGLMNYPLAWAILGFAAGGSLDAAVAAQHGQLAANLRPLDGTAFAARLTELAEAYARPAAGAHLNLVGSHDLPRILTICGGDQAAVRLAMLVLLTLPGAPCIYYGDEIGLAGHGDPDCRRAFPWDEARWDVGLRDVVRRAIALRLAEPSLRGSEFRVVAAEGAACAYRRGDGAHRLVIAINGGTHPAPLAIPERQLTAVLATEQAAELARIEGDPAHGAVRLTLPPRSGGVWRAEPTGREVTG